MPVGSGSQLNVWSWKTNLDLEEALLLGQGSGRDRVVSSSSGNTTSGFTLVFATFMQKPMTQIVSPPLLSFCPLSCCIFH